MSIAPYGSLALAARRADQNFKSLKSSLATQQVQLTTGKIASNYADLGQTAATSLSARSQISALDAYASNVKDAQLRVSLLSPGLDQIGKIANALKTSLPGSYKQTQIGQTSAQVSAEDGFKQVLEILNTEVGGRYLLSGRAVDTPPTAPFDLIIDGDASHAGLKQLISERRQADLGPDGRGRLQLSSSGNTIGLSEEAAGLPFGLKIVSATATGAGVTASDSAGPPASASITVAQQPAEGDTVSIGFILPDGTTTTFTLTAIGGASGTSTSAAPTFAIGANASETATNLKNALDSAIQSTASTTLASASALNAANAFFAGSASNPPQRVSGPPFATATTTVAGTADDAVIWYRGDDGVGSARGTSPVRTGDATSVAIGARANEAGFQSVLAALGILAADSFSDTDPTSQKRYEATADRVSGRIGETPLLEIVSELSAASVSLSSAADRIGASKNQFETVVDGVEAADPSKVASELLATQTRLQASYQTTSVIAKLSLVNFI